MKFLCHETWVTEDIMPGIAQRFNKQVDMLVLPATEDLHAVVLQLHSSEVLDL